MTNSRSDDAFPITFVNVGSYPMTIGRERVAPGGSTRRVLEKSALPKGWNSSEVHVELGRPEESGVESRDLRGIIELAIRKTG
jgi:hypothetical protein